MPDEIPDATSLKVQETLNSGPYACSNLTRLSGGTANFVYRGTLITPSKEGKQTVVIKHTEGYVAQSPDFKLTVERCDYEQTILTALHSFPPIQDSGVAVQTPQLHHFDDKNNNQVYEDLPSALDLKTYCLSHALAKSECDRIGQALGLWTQRFHSWTREDEQKGLVDRMKGNKEMRDLKFMVNYDRLIGSIDMFPDLLEGSRGTFEKIRERVRNSLDDKDSVQLIHGDYWSGNVLLPSGPLKEETKLFIIDWELSQVSFLAFDLGQMFAELFELKHFKDIDAGIWLIESFMRGYGELNEETAWQVLVHIGTHLICWGSRVVGWGSEQQVADLVGIGRDLILDGWGKRREVLMKGVWKCLMNG